MSAAITLQDLILHARDLASEAGENREYDRALVELVAHVARNGWANLYSDDPASVYRSVLGTNLKEGDAVSRQYVVIVVTPDDDPEDNTPMHDVFGPFADLRAADRWTDTIGRRWPETVRFVQTPMMDPIAVMRP